MLGGAVLGGTLVGRAVLAESGGAPAEGAEPGGAPGRMGLAELAAALPAVGSSALAAGAALAMDATLLTGASAEGRADDAAVVIGLAATEGEGAGPPSHFSVPTPSPTATTSAPIAIAGVREGGAAGGMRASLEMADVVLARSPSTG